MCRARLYYAEYTRDEVVKKDGVAMMATVLLTLSKDICSGGERISGSNFAVRAFVRRSFVCPGATAIELILFGWRALEQAQEVYVGVRSSRQKIH